MAADDETLWVNGYLLTAAQMIHVDVPTRRARLIGFGVTALGGVAATSDAVWATTESGVARIDPATDDVTATVEIEGLLTGVAVTRRAVWVTNQTDRTIVRIDPATNRIVTTIDLGVRANAVAAAGGAVWVTNLDNGVVTRIDEATNEIADTVDAAPGAERLRGVADESAAGRSTKCGDPHRPRQTDPSSLRRMVCLFAGGVGGRRRTSLAPRSGPMSGRYWFRTSGLCRVKARGRIPRSP